MRGAPMNPEHYIIGEGLYDNLRVAGGEPYVS
jgi:hypothetical protein